MYISDIDGTAGKAVKTALVYLVASLFCAGFGAIYESFSHEVYSYYMIYAFLFPLAGGTLPFLMIAVLHGEKPSGSVSGNLYHSGIITLTVGSIMRGILDIYGTTNRLLNFYWIVGTVLAATGATAYFIRIKVISFSKS